MKRKFVKKLKFYEKLDKKLKFQAKLVKKLKWKQKLVKKIKNWQKTEILSKIKQILVFLQVYFKKIVSKWF